MTKEQRTLALAAAVCFSTSFIVALAVLTLLR